LLDKTVVLCGTAFRCFTNDIAEDWRPDASYKAELQNLTCGRLIKGNIDLECIKSVGVSYKQMTSAESNQL
jgi:hypothetical protein